MSQPSSRVRIYSHVTQSRFLHIEDTLNIDKLRLFAGTYRKGSGRGMEAHAIHYLDSADARVVFSALAQGQPGFNRREYKGTPAQDGQPTVSRVLSVAVNAEKAYIELKSGPGKLTPTGAILPNRSATASVNVAFSLYEAQRLALTVLAFLQAFDVLKMQQLQAAVSSPAPYLLVPVTAQVQPPIVSGNMVSPDNETDSLRYVDGTEVSAENPTEQQAFTHYQQTNGTPPENRSALQTFYRQQVAA